MQERYREHQFRFTISLRKVENPKMNEIKRINPKALAPPPGDRYSHVVRSGNLLWISGQTSRNQAGEVVGLGDTLAQARQINENLRIAIEAAGGTMNDIVKVTIFLTKNADVEAARQAQNEYRLEYDPPASSMVIIEALANPDYLIEVEAFAVVN